MHWADSHSLPAQPQPGDGHRAAQDLAGGAASAGCFNAAVICTNNCWIVSATEQSSQEIITCNYPAQCSRSEPKQSFLQHLQELFLVLFPDPTKQIPGMGLRKQMNPNFPLRTFVPSPLPHTVHILRTPSTTVRQQQWDGSAGIVSVLVTPELWNTQPLGYVSKHTPSPSHKGAVRDRSCLATQTWGCRGQGCQAGQDTGELVQAASGALRKPNGKRRRE